MSRPSSLFARVIGRQRPFQVTIGIVSLLMLLPMGAAHLDGVVGGFFSRGYWRLLLLAPAVITYILVVSPIMARREADVVNAFRLLAQMDDDSLDRLISQASRINPAGEMLALGGGAALGLWISQSWIWEADWNWLGFYLPVSASLMFGVLGWTIYAVLAGTRLSTVLHRQPLRVDIFNIAPFEAIGRQSLLGAMAFAGGIVLSMVFSLPAGADAWQGWLLIGALMLVPILIFFLGMRDTHRVLAAEKARELRLVRQYILQASRILIQRMAANQDTGSLGAEVNALAVYESHLVETKTWPYDMPMLRTLFFSVVLPAGAALAQVAFERLL